MRALTFQGKQSIEYTRVDDPKIEDPQDVIIKVELAGLCGSDLHPYHEREKGLDQGVVMGHEGVGVVVEKGAGVKMLKAGDRVFGPFTTNCGACFYCEAGLTCRCEKGQLFGWKSNGVGLHGLQAEYARIPLADTTLSVIPADIHSEEALLLGDVLSTGAFCAELAEAQKGGVYVVVGAGPVGLLATAAAKHRGAERVFVVDVVTERLELAKTFGAEPLNATDVKTKDIIFDVTKGRGVDAAMECVGSEAAARLAYQLLRPGGVLAVAGVHCGADFGFSPSDAYNKNLTYRVGRCPARAMIPKLLPLVRSHEFDLRSVISHRQPLSEGKRAYEIFDRKLDSCTKVVFAL